MPLLDHFHAPLHPVRRWDSFLLSWACSIVKSLNCSLLPKEYRAWQRICVGGRLEEETIIEPAFVPRPEGGDATVIMQEYSPPSPILTMPAVFTDEFEVLVDDSYSAAPVAVVMLASPGNKDRPEVRLAFAAKAASYLQQGAGLVIVDIVTSTQANLHDSLIQLLQLPLKYAFPGAADVYTIAYRPARRKAGDQIDLWPMPLAVGQALSTVPLALRGGPTLPVDLEATYTQAREWSRL